MPEITLLRISGKIDRSSFEKTYTTLQRISHGGTLIVFINSTGGSVEDALKIRKILADTMIEKEIYTVCIGYGVVASSATLVFLSGMIRLLYLNTRFMIHAPTTTEQGNELSKVHIESLKNIYLRTLTITREILDEAFVSDRYFTLDEKEKFKIVTHPFRRIASFLRPVA
jgi:ATP-dependent protease ClpP protease subunit